MRQFGNGEGAPDSLPPEAPTFSWPKFGPWLLGLLILSGVIVTVTSFSEIEGFVQLLRQADPVWLVAGIILQIATYFSTAAIWLLTLRKGGTRYSILTLVPLGVAKLFSEQASIFLLDAATLWTMLRAIGQDVSFLLAFPSFIVASMVASLGLIPLGLGTFEATSIAMLRSLGVPLEAALTATLLLLGLTL
jgi:uncharacterized membrane protein YbhN (UPF0104 family)